MATSDLLASVIQQSNEALAETLAGAFKNLRYQRASTVRLAKFCGSPKRSGDPTLKEWTEDLHTYIRQLDLSKGEQVSVAVDHLGGVAREEILCCPKEEKDTLEKVLTLLRRRFGSPETVQTLNCTFYSRVQGEDESLADFSRALIRLYDRMESASTNSNERTALAQLRDGALKEQFIRGARDNVIRRELRKISHDEAELCFFAFRELSLKLLRDSDEGPTNESRCDPYSVDRVSNGTVIDTAGPAPRNSDDQKLLASLAEGQKQLTTLMQGFINQQAETNAQLKSLTKAVENLESILSATPDYVGQRPDRRPRGPK